MRVDLSRATKLIFALVCLLGTEQAFSQTGQRKFYKYDVVAATSSSLEVFAAPSINDYGDVAFAGRKTPGGGTVFLNEIGGRNVDMMPSFSSNPSQIVGGRVQINNSQQVIQHTFVTGTTPAQNFLRRIDGVNNFTLIAAGNGTGSFNDFNQIYPGSIGLNNCGDPVYLTRNLQSTTIPATGIRPDFSLLEFPSTGDSLKPAISDCGFVAVRAGANATDPIRLYLDDFSEFDTIASTADGFTALGLSPAISNFCEVVTFYGDLNQAGADALGTNPGPGIFASIEIDQQAGTRRIVRLAGRLIENISAPGGNDDGYCDPGETCMQGELGFNRANSPIFFSSFDALNRVAVTHQSVGAAGIEDDIFVVSFLATPNIASDSPQRPFSNQPGLWTLTTQIKNELGVLREKPSVAVPVVQIGDVVNTRTITGINVYDQLASVRVTGSPAESPGAHRLAFHVTTDNGNMILRANRKVDVPVIFIPGIAGSTLVEKTQAGSEISKRWIGNPAFILGNIERLADLTTTATKIVATDATRRYLELPIPADANIVYKSLLEDSLILQGGLREYLVEGKEERRTYDGCDMSQRFRDPTLFVFAYDWRKSNVENAEKLKNYVECVQRIYPGTQVDIVAHSMGGLMARRYITQFPTTNNVRKLITVGSPFLGAPAALQTAENGRLHFLPDFVNQNLPSSVSNPIRSLARNSPAIHQLFPSESYFTLGGRPFEEERFDINEDGIVPQIYDYPRMFSFFNARFPTVYSTNDSFHSYRGQDDWRQDTSNVEFYHVIGRRSTADTIDRFTATPVLKRPRFDARRELRLRAKRGIGDKTVPNVSSERCETENCETGLNYNAPNAEITKCISESKAQDALCDHVGLIKAEDVREEILNILDLPFQPSVAQLGPNNSMIVKTRDKNGPTGAVLPSLKEGYYLSISGGSRVSITDESGNTNTPVGDAGFELGVPGVSFSGGIYEGEGSYQEVSMPAEEGEYTIKFRTGTDSLDIEILKGVGNTSPNLSIRYLDLELPPNVDCLLTFSPAGVPDLSYDSNGDGTYDVVVPAHVRVSGAAAQDVTAPTVTVTYGRPIGARRRITIDATDAQSGVKTVYYRVDETRNYQVYSGPFLLTAKLDRVIEAFADDNAGNRSSPGRVVIPRY